MKTTKWFASISLSRSLGCSLAGSYACSLAGFLAGSLFFCSLGFAAPGELKFASVEDSQAEFDRSVKPVLAKFCSKCHGPELKEKDLDLQTLSPDMKGSTSAARWAVVLAELSLGKMPPKGEAQPSAESLKAINAWIQAELKRAGKHVAARLETQNGNAVPHALLFGGKPRSGIDVATRVRPISPEIYEAFAKDVGKGAGVGQPFTPNPATTFKDMGAARLDEPTTSQLLGNALLMVEQFTSHKLEDGVAKAERQAPKELVRLFDEKNPATESEIHTAIKFMFNHVLRRAPTAEELAGFSTLIQRNIQDAGRKTGVRYSLAAVLLLPEAVLRSERGQGKPDAAGRVRLAPRELAFAWAYALTDRRPEPWLLADADAGKLDSADGVRAALRKMLDDPKLEKPRIMRFFREFFGYAKAVEVFKGDDVVEHYPRDLVADTDRLIEWILERDRDVFRELMSTNKSFVNYRWDAKKQQGVRANNNAVHLAYGLPPDWKWTDKQPIELPANQRAGVLTQPAWLVAFSKNDDNDAIHRGIWVRERLLGGVIPNLPITVDAQLPIAPERTLRERMAVTHEAYCWSCHQLINRTAYPFEIYDHFGRFRTRELVDDLEATAKNVDPKGKPLGIVKKGVTVNSSGSFDLVEEEALRGDVANAIDFARRLADSQFAEQVFVRHAFRYWLGRNETPGDAASLQAAHQAYKDNGGSMKALIAALLTSDSFLFRVPEK
jgi:mono/diheme cytochrome c family protein